jgi:hypothetical protein
VLSHQLSPALKQSLAFKILKKDKKDQLLKFKNTFPIEIIKNKGVKELRHNNILSNIFMRLHNG